MFKTIPWRAHLLATIRWFVWLAAHAHNLTQICIRWLSRLQIVENYSVNGTNLFINWLVLILGRILGRSHSFQHWERSHSISKLWVLNPKCLKNIIRATGSSFILDFFASVSYAKRRATVTRFFIDHLLINHRYICLLISLEIKIFKKIKFYNI